MPVVETNLFKAPASPVEREVVTDVMRRRPNDPFAHDRFLLSQRHLSWSDQGEVCAADQTPLFAVRRVAGVTSVVMASLAAGITFSVIVSGFLWVALRQGDDIAAAILVSGVMTATGVTLVVTRCFSGKRHVTMTSLATNSVAVDIQQDRQFQLVVSTYTVRDGEGDILAYVRKNHFLSLIRRCWVMRSPQGALLMHVREDHFLLACLRRLLGNFFGLLRTHFILQGDDGRQLGRFNRRLHVRERNFLDLTPDFDATVDRRIGVAMGVMLDTMERR